MQERRDFSRVNYAVEATLEFAGETFASDLIDLSLKGVLVSTAASPRKGQEVQLRFRLVQEADVEIHCGGSVVRADHRGIGIAFTDVDVESFNRIRSIVSANSGDPEHVESEFASYLRSRSDS
jgi:hypothetical protein